MTATHHELDYKYCLQSKYIHVFHSFYKTGHYYNVRDVKWPYRHYVALYFGIIYSVSFTVYSRLHKFPLLSSSLCYTDPVN